MIITTPFASPEYSRSLSAENHNALTASKWVRSKWVGADGGGKAGMIDRSEGGLWALRAYHYFTTHHLDRGPATLVHSL